MAFKHGPSTHMVLDIFRVGWTVQRKWPTFLCVIDSRFNIIHRSEFTGETSRNSSHNATMRIRGKTRQPVQSIHLKIDMSGFFLLKCGRLPVYVLGRFNDNPVTGL